VLGTVGIIYALVPGADAPATKPTLSESHR
jgi:hypothetical protein